MQIFDGILKQYVQLALINIQYKRNLQSLDFNKSLPSVENDAEFVTSNTTLNTLPKTTEIYYNYNKNLNDIKDFYEKMEFDARRYNRNFDSQTGAFLL